MSTAFPGSRNETQCGCAREFYLPKGNVDCIKCSTGLSCPTFGHAEANWDIAMNDPDFEGLYPAIAESYWAPKMEPTSIFKCQNANACAGGMPGPDSCGDKRGGTACGICQTQYAWAKKPTKDNWDEAYGLQDVEVGSKVTNKQKELFKEGNIDAMELVESSDLTMKSYSEYQGRCQECDFFKPWRFTLSMVMSPFLVLFLYKFLNFRFADVISMKRACAHTWFLMFVYMQTIALIQDFSLNMPQGMADVGVGLSLLIVDTSPFRLSCGVLDGSVKISYAMSLLVPFWFLLATIFTYAFWHYIIERIFWKATGPCSKLPTLELPKVQNMYLTVLNTFYIGMTRLAASAFQCYSHPNGKRSMLAYSQVLCTLQDDQWAAIMPQALVGMGFYTFGVFAIFGMANLRAPKMFHEDKFRKRWLFLLTKFRPEYWWWDQVLLLKGVCLNLTTIMFKSGTSQAYWVILLNVTNVWCLFVVRPWRHHLGNYVDMTIQFSVLAILALCLYFADQNLYVDLEFSYTAWMVTFMFIPVLVAGITSFKYVRRYCNARVETHNRLIFARQLQSVFQWTLERRAGELNQITLRCTDHDMKHLRGAQEVLLAELLQLQPSTKRFSKRLIMGSKIGPSAGQVPLQASFSGLVTQAKASEAVVKSVYKVAKMVPGKMEFSEHVDFADFDKVIAATGVPCLQNPDVRRRLFSSVDHRGIGRCRREELLGAIDYILSNPDRAGEHAASTWTLSRLGGKKAKDDASPAASVTPADMPLDTGRPAPEGGGDSDASDADSMTTV